MKKTLLITLVFYCLFSFGKCCSKKKKSCRKKDSTAVLASNLNTNEIWMRFNETKCANPWNFNWFMKPSQDQVVGAVKSDLIGKGIAILEIRSSLEKDFIYCDACDCPNGTHFYVRVNKSEIEKLKVLKFFETKDVPEMESINTIK